MREERPAGNLHGPTAPTGTTSEPHLLVVEALTRLTHTLQCHRAISDEFERDLLVGSLLVLHDAGVPLDEALIHAWVTAHHWSDRAVGRLAVCVRDINAGTDRLRARCYRRITCTSCVDV